MTFIHPRRLEQKRFVLLPLAVAWLWAGCGAAYVGDDDSTGGATETSADGSEPWSGDDDAYYGDDDSSTGDDDDGDDDDVLPTLPPEVPDSFYRTKPAGGDLYVFVVNPDNDTVSKINASTQAVYTIGVGTHPTQVVVGPDDPRKALVLNEGDATISIIDTRTDEIQTVPIHQDTNYMNVTSDGQYAVTYFDPRVEDADTDINGVRSFSSISVVYTGDATSEPTSTPIAVALNPQEVTFVPSTGEAIVLCDEAIALVSLSPEPSARIIALTDDIEEDLDVEELVVGSDGRYVFLRLGSQAELVVVDLDEGGSGEAVSRIALPAVPSDMALADHTLVLVDRTDHELLVFDAMDPGAEPAVVPLPENQLVGSIAVAPDNRHAILYTTLTEADIRGTAEDGTPLDRFSVWDLETDDISVKELVKPVEGVAIGSYKEVQVVTILHDGSADSNVDVFAYEEAFSEYYMEDDLVVPTLLEAPVTALAESSDGLYQFMIMEDDLSVVVVDYMTRQAYSVDVQSQPVFVGALTDTNLAYVSQEYELGRLSFIDPETLSVSTITGFELNAQP